MEQMMNKSKVYAQTDAQNRITHLDGGYTIGNIRDTSQWTLIDEGRGDKFNLCQSNYLPKPLYEEHGIPRYKLVNGFAVERTQAEIDADIAAIPAPPPTPQEDADALLADHEERLIYMELGV